MSPSETNCECPGKVCGPAWWGEQDDLCLCRLRLVLPVGELEEGSCQGRVPWRLSVCALVLAHRAGRPGHVWGCVGHPWWEEALSGLGCFWPKP